MDEQDKPPPDETQEDEKSANLWATVALVLGYNELAKKAESLGEKVYFRLARDTAEALFIERGGAPILEPTAFVLELEVPTAMPRVRFREQDIELMRQTVAAHDSAGLGPRISPPDDRIAWRIAELVSSGRLRELKDAQIFQSKGGLILAYRDLVTGDLVSEVFP